VPKSIISGKCRVGVVGIALAQALGRPRRRHTLHPCWALGMFFAAYKVCVKKLYISYRERQLSEKVTL
jgi:hypothetical protein